MRETTKKDAVQSVFNWLARLAGIMALVGLLAATQSAEAETQFIPVDSAQAGEGIVAIKEMTHTVVARRFVSPPNNSGSTNYASLCPEAEDGSDRCAFEQTDSNFAARAVLPVCTSTSEENCVVSLRFASGDGELISAELIRSIDMQTYPYEDPRGLFRSGAASLWRLPGLVHAGGTDTYFVNVSNDMNFDPGQRRFVVTSVKATISPYVTKYGNYERIGLYETECSADDDCPTGYRLGGWGSFECVWQETGVCGVAVDFAEESVFELNFRASTDLVGWFRGRIQKSEISIEDFSRTNSLFSVKASPVEVPRFEAKITDANTTPAQQKLAEDGVDTTAGAPADGYVGPRIFGGNIAKGQMAMSPTAIEWVNAFKHITGDSAIAVTQHWNFETVFYSGDNVCLSGKHVAGVLGVVSTNATALEGTPPNFDGGYLSYRIAGLHYQPDGVSLNLGTYDLLMRSDVARCLYGFSKAPVSATVQVVNESGDEVVATTIVSEKDGWLKLAAYGFTFSEKEIQVQLRQSQIKTLTNFTSSYLSAKQKAEIRAVLAKSDGNTKFICTGIRYYQQPMRENIKVRARAKAACDYAQSINPNFSYWYQTKTTQARSYNGKVMVVSKG